MLKRLLRKIVQPFAPFTLTPGQYYSRLEAEIEPQGLHIVEDAFTNHAGAKAVQHALGPVLGETRLATLALKKSLHVMVEERLRTLALQHVSRTNTIGSDIAPPQGSHPIDVYVAPHVQNGEDNTHVRNRTLDSLKHWQRLIALSIAVALKVFAIGLRHAQTKPNARAGRVLILNCSSETPYLPLERVMLDKNCIEPGEVVCELPPAHNFQGLYPCIKMAELPVAHQRWLRETALPAVRQIVLLVATVLRHRDALSRELAIQALRLVNLSFDFHRLRHTFQFDWLIDNMEYDPRHIVAAAVLNGDGIGLARWPHSELDAPGILTSYLGYNVFFSSGRYQYDTYHASWRRDLENHAVGMLQNDPLLVQARNHVDPSLKAAIQERLDGGHRMIVLFGPSSVPGSIQAFKDLMRRALNVIDGHPDVFLMIKAKGTNDFYRHLDADPRFAHWRAADNILWADYAVVGTEVCPVGFLLPRMTCAIGGVGSVVLESLVHKKPCFSLVPFPLDTPFQNRLRESGLAHCDLDTFTDGFSRYLADPTSLSTSYEWVSAMFSSQSPATPIDQITDCLCKSTSRIQGFNQ